MTKHSTVDDYIAALPDPVRQVAIDLRQTIMAAAPNANNTIRYDMPAFNIGETTFLYFACWKKHVGLYPIYKGDEAFEGLVGPYRAKKDTVQFMYRDPLPKELVIKIVRSQLMKLQ
jgi:uncharacterized protein YdhG (YjbR/CyaY superfamily)